MIYIALFILLVFAIAVVTHRLNWKKPCNHNWKKDGHNIKCCNCGKKIPDHVALDDEHVVEAA